MSEYSNQQSIIGTLVSFHQKGILFIGKSESGKSEAALEFVKRGHKLVSDDLVLLKKNKKHEPVGYAPKEGKGMLHIRKIGFIHLNKLYGKNSIQHSQTIDMIIELRPTTQYDKSSMNENDAVLFGKRIPYFYPRIRS